jgi:hypothetical protein
MEWNNSGSAPEQNTSRRRCAGEASESGTAAVSVLLMDFPSR